MAKRIYREDIDRYTVIKGQALTMAREFKKCYPTAPQFDINDRITNEVWYAANIAFPNAKEINAEKLHQIIREVKAIV